LYFSSITEKLYFLCTGANPSLTAAVVVVTGLVGANFVQATLDRLRFSDPIARGIATASRYFFANQYFVRLPKTLYLCITP